MRKEQLRTLDFFMGLGFAGVGIFMIIESIEFFNAPMLQGYPKYANPGVFTGFVGILLAAMGLSLSAIGFRESGGVIKTARESLAGLVKSPGFYRGLLVIALLGIYYFGLIGHMRYVLATFIFLAVTMITFKATAWWKALIISAVASYLVAFFFGTVAHLPLP